MHDTEQPLFSSAQWQAIADGLNDGVLVNIKGKHVFANRRIEELLEYAPGELIGTALETVIHPDALPQVSERWRLRVQGIPVPQIYESSFISKSGKKIPVELSVSVLPWAGQEAGVVTIRDIAERKRHIDQIRRSSRLLEYFFKDSHTCFALVDGNLNFTRVNTSFADLFKRDVDFFSAKPFAQFFPREKQDLLRQVFEHGVVHHMNADQLHIPGRAGVVNRYCNWSIIPIYDDAARVEYVGVSLADVTEQTATKLQLEQREQELLAHRDNLEELVRQRTGQLLESESRFRRMADSAPSLIWLVDEQNNLLWFNKSWLAYTGTSADEHLGWLNYTHPDERSMCKRIFDDAWRNQCVFSMEHRLRRHNNTYGWVTIVGVPRFTDDGSFEGYIGYCWDMTEQKRTELELSVAKEQSENASRAKSEFLSRMSHELRTPLNAVLGFAQLLQTDLRAPLLPGQQESINEILRAGYHLLELITEILDLSQVESGRVHISLTAVDLGAVIDECISLVTPMADKRGVSIRFYTAEMFGLRVSADAIRLKQIMLNLLSNAVKYNRHGGNVEVSVVTLSEDCVRVNFRDTGIGIAAHRAGEIFVPFNRLGAESTDIEGTGIGLVITKRLVEMIGGNIGFSSEPGVGSTFWIEIQMAAGLVVQSIDTAGPRPAVLQRVLTVLYIDVDCANVRKVERVLARHTHIRLLTAQDEKSAMRIVADFRPDLVMVDWDLATLGNGSLVGRLRDTHANTRIVAYGDAAGHQPEELACRNVYAYVTRDSLLKELVSIIGQIAREVA